MVPDSRSDAVGSSCDVGVFVFEERMLIMASSKKDDIIPYDVYGCL
jgi:hypothetical protein